MHMVKGGGDFSVNVETALSINYQALKLVFSSSV